MPTKPKPTDTESQFLNRCMEEYEENYPNEDERSAFCQAVWNKTSMARGLRPMMNESEVAFIKRVDEDEEMRKLHPDRRYRNSYARQWYKLGPRSAV